MNQDEYKAWYVLTSKPQKDAYAEEQLNNQGYTTYRPLAMRERRFRDKMIKVTESLFPQYIFIQLGRVGDNCSSICSTHGIDEFMRFGGLPLSVPDALIDDLRRYESQFPERAIDLDHFQRGDVVRVGSGSFQDLDVVFERYSSEERATLLMNMLNEQPKVVGPVGFYKMA